MSDRDGTESRDGAESGDGERDGASGQEGENGQQGRSGQENEQRQGGQEGQQGQSGQGSQQGQGGQGKGEQQPSTAERVLTGISVAFTLLLFGYVAWHAVQAPGGTQPQVEVVGTERLANGSVLVRVEFTNAGDEGLLSVTAQVACSQPPPDVTLENVPAGGVQRATLVCPSGTTNPDAEVTAWIPT